MSQSYLICAIGDSRTRATDASIGYDPVSLLGKQLQQRYPFLQFQVNNKAVDGATTLSWCSQPYFTTALTSFVQNADAMPLGTKTYVQIMLGVNDASGFSRIPVSTYAACVEALINAIKSCNIRGFSGIILHNSFYTVPYGFLPEYDDLCLSLVQQYNNELLSFVDNKTVFLGDQKSYVYFEQYPELMFDKLHLGNEGNAALATLWADAYHKIIEYSLESESVGIS